MSLGLDGVSAGSWAGGGLLPEGAAGGFWWPGGGGGGEGRCEERGSSASAPRSEVVL